MRLALCALVLGLALFAVACDPGVGFRYENKTKEVLFVEANGSGLNRLSPHKGYDVGYLTFGTGGIGQGDNPLGIHLIDVNGCTVLDLHTTVAKFKNEHDFKLVIYPPDLPPREQRTACDPRLAGIARQTQE